MARIIKSLAAPGVVLIFAALFVTFFSVTTSPLWGFLDSQDSYVYYLIGKEWMNGAMPYVDLWDQKGPVIYLLNGWGWLLTHSRTGVFLVQLLFMGCTAWTMYRLLIIQMDKKAMVFSSFFFFLALYSLYEDGNMVEEFSLPFLLGSFCFQYKWVNDYVKGLDVKHRPLFSLLYGFTLAFCLYTRLTNALGICGGVAFITIVLIVKKQYRNILDNALWFIAGFLLLFLPVALYFYAKGAFYDMWYGTFLYNLNYAGRSAGNLIVGFLSKFCFRTYVDVYACMGAAVLLVAFGKERRIVGWWLLSVSLLLWYWLVNSFAFGHYGIIAVPYACLVLSEAYVWFKRNSPMFSKLAWGGLLFAYATMVVSKDVATTKALLAYAPKGGVAEVDTLMKLLPDEGRSHFVGYNVTPYCYLNNDITPCYPYFTCQDFTMSASREHYKRVMEAFSQCSAQWILVRKEERNVKKEIYIRPILEDNYMLVASKGEYNLYSIKP